MEGKRYNPKVIADGIAGAVMIGFHLLLSPLTRPWYSRWGATEEEIKRTLPGDELVPRAKTGITCAVSIQAPASQVWPWLVQIGCQRAGWYSYDLLDNGGIPSADEIIEEHQHLEIGDGIPFTTDGKMAFPVEQIDESRALILGGTINTRTGQPVDHDDTEADEYFSGAILFFLYEVDDDTTRLLYRMPLGWSDGWRNGLMYRGFLEPISFVMARKTLLGIKRRVENGSRRLNSAI